ncbi:MAG: NAD(P)/FAD-dependent oxidoreductase [Nitrososphaeria archaeon]
MSDIAIAGMGPAGAYLASLLGERAEVYEMQQEESFTSVCAWGTGSLGMKELLKQVGINVDDYILFPGKRLYLEFGGNLLRFWLDGLATFDKPRLMKDLTKGIKVHYGTRVYSGFLESRYKIAVDATGVYRRLLSPIKNDFLLPTVQYMVKYSDMPYDDFYITPFENYGGYLWFFPLGDKRAFVGAGNAVPDHEKRVLDFITKTKGEIIQGSRRGKAIRLIPPSMAEPHFKMNAVGVGESVGTVFPLVGEGILPSMVSAKMLYDNEFDYRAYSVKLNKFFEPYDAAFKLILNKMKRSGGFFENLSLMLTTLRYIRGNSKMVGMKVGVSDMLNVLRFF